MDALLVLGRELVLLPFRVQRGERVLPPPDDDSPDEGEGSGDDQDRSEDSKTSPHLALQRLECTLGCAPAACADADDRGAEHSSERSAWRQLRGGRVRRGSAYRQRRQLARR